MRNVILVLMMFTVSGSSFAQIEKNQEWSVFITPTSILNPSYPAFHIGSERKGTNWGSVIELGVLLPKSFYHNSTSAIGLQDFSSINRGFFIKAEEKWYWNKNLYLGLNASVLFNNYTRTDMFDETPEITEQLVGFWFCSNCVEDTYNIKKTRLNTSLKVGAKFDFENRMYVDGYFGLGFSYHWNRHQSNTELHKNPAIADGLVVYYDAHYPGNFLYRLPVPILGIRVGYNLK
jgi:hypothetical protein